jgi:peptidoglycan/xylan/chitin deacetylase (PgdA/CDA1 family)
VPASALHDAAAARRRWQRIPLAITFDDDDAAHASVSAPILRRHGAPATFFLNGASLAAPFRFWWEALQLAVDRGLADERLLGRPVPGDIHALALGVQTLPPAERDAVAGRLEALVGAVPPDAGMRAAQVGELVAGGFEIGFHTRRHDFLTILDEEALARAMAEGRDDLETLAGRPLDSIAYPHGGAGAREAEAARRAGFRWGFTTELRAVTKDTDPLLMGRVECSFRSVGHLALRLVRALTRG